VIVTCSVTGKLCASVVAATQLSVGARSAAADDQTGPVCESVLERAALRAALDRCRRVGGGVGGTSVAQRYRRRHPTVGEGRRGRLHETPPASSDW